MAGIPQQVQDGNKRADELIEAQRKANAGEHPDAVSPSDPNKPEHTETVESLTHKLSVLQGKYNKEILALGDDPNLLNTLKAENRQLRRQNADFSRIISDQQNELAKRSLEKPPTEKPAGEVTTDLDEDDLDLLKSEGLTGEVLEVINKLVDKRADKIAQARYGDLSKQVETVQHYNAVTKEERFFKDLSKAVPNWSVINGTKENPNEDWLGWLDGKAPYQDRSRADVLHEAQARLDAKTCVDIFNDYIAEKGIAQGAKPKVDDPKRINPADLLEPGASSIGEVPKDAPTYTMDEYKAHYNLLTKDPRRAQTDEVWLKKTALLDKALSEGRIK